MKAVVMAGGEGSRLRPLTSNRPKPLVPVCNQPIMEHILTLLKRHGITEVVATLHYLADEIQGYFGDGSDFGVSMDYSIEDTPLGTAGSVKKAEDLLNGGTFLIVSGDALTDCDLTKAIEFHKRKGGVGTLILARVPSPLEFGVVITDEEDRVVRFLEKPSWSEVFSDTVNTGMYILEPEIFAGIEAGQSVDWSGDVFPKLLESGRPMFGYVMDEYWTDIGSISQYSEAHEHFLARQLNLPLLGEERTSGILVGPNCLIDEGAILMPPVCIGRNCKIKAGAKIGPYTSVGDNAFVDTDAKIERSVVWDSAYIGPNVGIHSAILCSRVTIKKDTIVREDAVVGDRCLIDVGCTIRPRIKLWPDKIVERGSTVTMSLIWGNKWRGNLFRELGVAGLSNIEITPDFACRLASAYGSTLRPKSRVVTSRDSTKSSRMIKRAVIASLLSVGCDVLDLSSAALPVARHFIKTSGASGAMNVRKLPGNSRVTLIELFDSRGAYLSKDVERKVESTFFREDYARTDPDDVGIIEFAARAVEDYQADYFRSLETAGLEKSGKRLRVVCDYGYSSLGGFFPAMLNRLGVDSIALNGYNDAKLAPRTHEEVERHVANLKQIVESLQYDIGVLFTNEGERIAVVDNVGEVLIGNDLLATVCALVAKTHRDATFALSVAAPTRLEQTLQKLGGQVIRTKADTRSLMNSSLEADVTCAGDDQGGFIFPQLHSGFDGPFAFGKLVTMLQHIQTDLHAFATDLPRFQLAYDQVSCPWEAKGTVMRRISEENRDDDSVVMVDGIKIFDADRWVLVRPDSFEPMFHVYAESPDENRSKEIVDEYVKKIEILQNLS